MELKYESYSREWSHFTCGFLVPFPTGGHKLETLSTIFEDTNQGTVVAYTVLMLYYIFSIPACTVQMLFPIFAQPM
jgi:hypothetical protein